MGRRQLVRITEPLPMDPLRPLVLGTVAWAVGLVVLVLLGDRLSPGQQWWTWTAAVGLVLGVVGCAVALRRARRQSPRRSSAATG
ncbi:DUF2530 domain-containing protein [Aquipuribacter sp. MA13-6]|uniref:DUF2530 domain-containing protein n=1 Tax=unclassified Aquipuribacter TaxID=2635084 RepID=UPI003EEFA128